MPDYVKIPILEQSDGSELAVPTEKILNCNDIKFDESNSLKNKIDSIGAGEGIKIMELNFASDTNKALRTATPSYLIKGYFKFGGTSNWGTPQKITIIENQEPGRTGGVKIYDVTNGNTIVEKTDMTNTDLVIHDMGSLNNLPSNEAIFEIQIKRVAGSPGLIFLYSLSMGW